jgi:hypothetical protein
MRLAGRPLAAAGVVTAGVLLALWAIADAGPPGHDSAGGLAGPNAGITASTCAELYEQLLERDQLLERQGELRMVNCVDAGVAQPAFSPAPVGRRLEPIELRSRYVEGKESCAAGQQRVIADGARVRLYAQYTGKPRDGYKLEYRLLGAAQSTVVQRSEAALLADLVSGSTYEWRVRAVRATGWSNWCEFEVRSQ